MQGFESQVIRGGKKTIDRAPIVVIETSFVELYEGQPLFADIYDQMRKLDFTYSGSLGLGQLRSPTNGLPLQQDAIFLRKI